MPQRGMHLSRALFLSACLGAATLAGCSAGPSGLTPPASADQAPPAAQPKAAVPAAQPREPGFLPPRAMESLLAKRGFQPERGGWHEDRTLGGWYSSSRFSFGGLSEISYYLESDRQDRVERLEFRAEIHNLSQRASIATKFSECLPDLCRGLGLSEEAIAQLGTSVKQSNPVTIRERRLVAEIKTESYRDGGQELGFYVTDEAALNRYKPSAQGK